MTTTTKTTRVKYLKVGDIVKDVDGTYAVAAGGGYFTPGDFVLVLQNTETKEAFSLILAGKTEVEVVGLLSKAETVKMVSTLRAEGVIPE